MRTFDIRLYDFFFSIYFLLFYLPFILLLGGVHLGFFSPSPPDDDVAGATEPEPELINDLIRFNSSFSSSFNVLSSSAFLFSD